MSAPFEETFFAYFTRAFATSELEAFEVESYFLSRLEYLFNEGSIVELLISYFYTYSIRKVLKFSTHLLEFEWLPLF